ncbi:MAG TPA: hypothetical protein VJA26_05705, partial [Gammaproteobacteria bacterium]|nr:hypothetical protein [Gammaproteobacteria bacterium]
GLKGTRSVVAGVAAIGAIATALVIQVAPTEAQQTNPARIAGHPNLNGVWQAIGTAHWNIEDHSARALEDFWQLGAIAAIPAGQSVVEGGTIPYLPDALAKRDENRAGWPKSDPEAKCYMPGIPRATYMPFPFRIVQGDGDILFVYEFASANRIVHMSNHQEPPVDSWMGWSNGRWEGDTLVIEVTGNNEQTWFDRAGNHHTAALKVTERYTLMGDNHLQYEATMEDPATFSRPWKITMPLYKRLEPNVQLLEFKCVEFSEELLYGDLTRKSE